MPDNHRSERVADQLLATLGRLLISDVRDPALAQVVLTRVSLTRDLQLARIYYAFQDPAANVPDNQKLVTRGLKRAEGFLRHEVAQRLSLRRVPKLEFFYDEALAYGRKIEDLMREIKASYPPPSEEKPEEK